MIDKEEGEVVEEAKEEAQEVWSGYDRRRLEEDGRMERNRRMRERRIRTLPCIAVRYRFKTVRTCSELCLPCTKTEGRKEKGNKPRCE